MGEPDELRTAVTEMLERLSTPGADEFAVHDYEGFGDYRVGVCDSLERISRVARGINDHGRAFAACGEQRGHDEDRLDGFADCYLGDWQSVEAYAQELLADLGHEQAIDAAVPEGLQP